MNEADAVRLDWMDARVSEATLAGESTLVLKLHAPCLPRYTPGAHVAVQCGELVRYYSLCDEGDAPTEYVLGVKCGPASTGGSSWLAEHAKPGATLRISAPRNNFPLDEEQSAYLFLSGGIGMTPMLSMLRRLRARGVKARWVHMCRSAGELAFADWIEDLASFHDVTVHFDDEAGRMYDIGAELRRAAPDTAVYCCGPSPMMSGVREIGETLGRVEHYHFEFFSAPAQPRDAAGGAQADAEFVVIQNSTGREIPVPASKTMLAALRDAGLDMKSECEYGVCGWCATGVIEGEPKHFDSYLTEAERASGKIVLPCVSRCVSRTIKLDI